MSPDELKRIDARWKSDMDKKVDALISFTTEYRPLLASLTAREAERAEFWREMRKHAAKVGIGSVLTSGLYAIWLWIQKFAGKL